MAGIVVFGTLLGTAIQSAIEYNIHFAPPIGEDLARIIHLKESLVESNVQPPTKILLTATQITLAAITFGLVGLAAYKLIPIALQSFTGPRRMWQVAEFGNHRFTAVSVADHFPYNFREMALLLNVQLVAGYLMTNSQTADTLRAKIRQIGKYIEPLSYWVAQKIESLTHRK